MMYSTRGVIWYSIARGATNFNDSRSQPREASRGYPGCIKVSPSATIPRPGVMGIISDWYSHVGFVGVLTNGTQNKIINHRIKLHCLVSPGQNKYTQVQIYLQNSSKLPFSALEEENGYKMHLNKEYNIPSLDSSDTFCKSVVVLKVTQIYRLPTFRRSSCDS